jgi:hypothetical protein
MPRPRDADDGRRETKELRTAADRPEHTRSSSSDMSEPRWRVVHSPVVHQWCTIILRFGHLGFLCDPRKTPNAASQVARCHFRVPSKSEKSAKGDKTDGKTLAENRKGAKSLRPREIHRETIDCNCGFPRNRASRGPHALRLSSQRTKSAQEAVSASSSYQERAQDSTSIEPFSALVLLCDFSCGAWPPTGDLVDLRRARLLRLMGMR